jgi:hypothetical protein
LEVLTDVVVVVGGGGDRGDRVVAAAIEVEVVP